MSTGYDAGKAALDDLIQWAEARATAGERTEAATRLHVMERLILDVLRWPRSTVHPEERAEPGGVGCALGSPGTKLVVGAKREGTYFDLPAGSRTGVHSIDSLTSGQPGQQLRLAMQQVIQYAASKGVGPAAICDGFHLVLFLATRTDGVAHRVRDASP